MDEDIHLRLGDRRYGEAFELLVSRYQQKVFRLAYSITGDEGAAEDAAQDAFVRVWRALPRFRGQSAIGTWIYAIARNAALTARKRAWKTEPLADGPAPQENVDAPDATRLLAMLDEKYRQVLVLYHLEERSYEEVSALLALPMGTVKTRIRRARRQLALALERAKIVERSR